MKYLRRRLSKSLLVAVFVVLTSGFQTIDTKTVAKNVTVYFPDGQTWHPSQKVPIKASAQTFPVVFFLQGTGGGDRRAESWSRWFIQHGIGAVIISSAKMRGLENLLGYSPYILASDVQKAIEVVKHHPQIDLTRYAVMGFSRGGTAALRLTTHTLDDLIIMPDFMFALYPAGSGGCGINFEDGIDVHIFYGELDDWGTYKDNRKNCKQLASSHENATFHLLENTHHGYDDSVVFDFKENGMNFHSEPNAAAREQTKLIILGAIRTRWTLTAAQ